MISCLWFAQAVVRDTEFPPVSVESSREAKRTMVPRTTTPYSPCSSRTL
jgi:hypothetical protein